MRHASADRSATACCRALPLLDGMALEPGRSRRTADRAIAFDQALTIVYRVLFLLFAEARRAGAGLERDLSRGLHDRRLDRPVPASLQSSIGRVGCWSALQAISRLAHAGCKAGDLDVTAFNGRLFSPRHTPLIEQRRVPDLVMRDVLLSLATEATSAGTPAHFLSRPRRRAARLGLRTRPRARTGSRRRHAHAQPHIDQAQSHRQLLHAAGADRVPGQADADAARRGQDRRLRSSSLRDRRSGDGQRRFPRRRLPLSCRALRAGDDSRWPVARRRGRRAADRASLAAQRRRAVPLRRRPQSDRGAAGAVVVVVDDAGGGSPADLSRSPPRIRQQLDRRAARRSVAADAAATIGPGASCAAAVRRSDRRRTLPGE